jgi:recombination protein RecA
MSAMDELASVLDKAIGENDEEQEVKHWLDTGYPPLNKIISGDWDKGIPCGRIIEMFGPPSSGKTLIATQIMQAAQKAGGIAGFNDHEYSYQLPFAKRLGLSDKFPQWIYRRPDTWEESNTLALKAGEAIRTSGKIPDEAPIVWVFDSVAAMIPASVRYDKDGKKRPIDSYNMNDTSALSRVAATTLKSINQMTAELNMTFIYLNQIRTKIGVVYGDPTTTPGGSAFEFFASVRLALGKKLIKDKSSGGVIAQVTGITTKKNKLTRPFQEVDLRLSFLDDGMAQLDFTTGLVELLVAEGKLESSGAWITWIDGKKYQKKSLCDKIDAEGSYEELKALVRTI